MLRDACFRKGNVAACKTLAFFGMRFRFLRARTQGWYKKRALTNLENLSVRFTGNHVPITTLQVGVCSNSHGDLARQTRCVSKVGKIYTLCFLIGGYTVTWLMKKHDLVSTQYMKPAALKALEKL